MLHFLYVFVSMGIEPHGYQINHLYSSVVFNIFISSRNISIGSA